MIRQAFFRSKLQLRTSDRNETEEPGSRRMDGSACPESTAICDGSPQRDKLDVASVVSKGRARCVQRMCGLNFGFSGPVGINVGINEVTKE